jgi:hypothetical protein
MIRHAPRHLHRLWSATVAVGLAGALLLALARPAPAQYQPSLNGHPVSLDSGGKIVPWLSTPEGAYTGVVRRAWGFLLNGVRTERNGRSQ